MTAACVKRGATSIRSRVRSSGTDLLAMPQLPDRHGRVGRVLIDVAVAVQRRLDIGGVVRLLRRATVDAAARHEEGKVDAHIATDPQPALESGLKPDALARKAPPVPTPREGHFNKRP